jgi:OST-HTH/LOTUS domain
VNDGASRRQGGRNVRVERAPVEQAIPLVQRALAVLTEREVSPQLGLLKSTLLQLDSTFSERSYGAGSFRDFVDKLAKAGVLKVYQAKGGWLVAPMDGAPSVQENGSEYGEPSLTHGDSAAQQAALPPPSPSPNGLGPVAVIGTQADGLQEFRNLLATAEIRRWPMYLRNVKQVFRQASPVFDERAYGFGNLVDLLRAAQKDGVVRMERDRQGVVRVFQGAAAPVRAVSAQPSQVTDAEPVMAAIENEAPVASVTSAAEDEEDISVGPGNVEQPVSIVTVRRRGREAAPRARTGATRRPRKKATA